MTELEAKAKDAEIAMWAHRAHNAEAMLVMFDKLHADGKFLQSALSEPMKKFGEPVRSATPSGTAFMIAVPMMPIGRVVMVPVDGDGCAIVNDVVTTQILMRTLASPQRIGWKGDFLALMSQGLLAQAIQDVAQMRVWMADAEKKSATFEQPTVDGKQ